MFELFSDNIQVAIAVVKENNKQAKKRNRLAKKQLQQSILNYEQLERQYLIEKSALQPTFGLFVTEFLMFEPDYLNDPELASEAAFLADLGIALEERVLRFRVRVKGDAEYRRPTMVVERNGETESHERAYSMSELLYFVPLSEISLNHGGESFIAYFVYRDKTTLPVVHKYRVTQLQGSTLSRWEVAHMDTVYASSHGDIPALKSAAGCEALFLNREAR